MEPELELAVEYPLGRKLRFRRTDRNATDTGMVNGAPMHDAEIGHSYVPVYVDRTSEIIYVNIKNILEDA